MEGRKEKVAYQIVRHSGVGRSQWMQSMVAPPYGLPKSRLAVEPRF